MRSIVTHPPEDNYIYAVNFNSLSLVKNELVNRTCTIPTTTTTTPRATTPPSTYPPSPVNGSSSCSTLATRRHTQTGVWRFRPRSLGFKSQGLGIQTPGFGDSNPGFGVQTSGFGVLTPGFGGSNSEVWEFIPWDLGVQTPEVWVFKSRDLGVQTPGFGGQTPGLGFKPSFGIILFQKKMIAQYYNEAGKFMSVFRLLPFLMNKVLYVRTL